MNRLICPCCGGELSLFDIGYKCKHCNSIFTENSKTEIEELRERLSFLEDKQREEKEETIARARRNLYTATTEKYLDVNKIKAAALDVKQFVDEDVLADFYLNVTSRSINEYLNEFDSYLYSDYLPIMLNFLLDRYPISLSNIIPLRNLIEISFDVEDKAKYNRKLEQKAKEIEEGIFDVDLPRDVFVAYSSKDYDKVYETVDYLEKNGFKCFVALRNLPTTIGSKENYQLNLEKAIRACKCFLFISSENSRDAECDAIKEEIPYLISHENIKRVEYLIEKYGRNTTKISQSKLKAAFKDLQWVIDKEDLVNRVNSLINVKYKFCIGCLRESILSVRFCPHCGSNFFESSYDKALQANAKKKSEEEYNKKLEELRIEKERKEAEDKLNAQKIELENLKKAKEKEIEDLKKTQERELEDLRKATEKKRLEDAIREQSKEIERLKSVDVSQSQIDGLVIRINDFLSKGQFDKVEEYCEKILDVDINSGIAYAYKLLLKLKFKSFDEITNLNDDSYTHTEEYLNAIKYGYSSLLEIEERRQEKVFDKAVKELELHNISNAKQMFLSILSMKKTKSYLERIKEEEKKEELFVEANLKFQKYDFNGALEILNQIQDYYKAPSLKLEVERETNRLRLKYEEGYREYQEYKEKREEDERIASELQTIKSEMDSLSQEIDSLSSTQEFAYAEINKLKKEQEEQFNTYLKYNKMGTEAAKKCNDLNYKKCKQEEKLIESKKIVNDQKNLIDRKKWDISYLEGRIREDQDTIKSLSIFQMSKKKEMQCFVEELEIKLNGQKEDLRKGMEELQKSQTILQQNETIFEELKLNLDKALSERDFYYAEYSKYCKASFKTEDAIEEAYKKIDSSTLELDKELSEKRELLLSMKKNEEDLLRKKQRNESQIDTMEKRFLSFVFLLSDEYAFAMDENFKYVLSMQKAKKEFASKKYEQVLSTLGSFKNDQSANDLLKKASRKIAKKEIH